MTRQVTRGEPGAVSGSLIVAALLLIVAAVAGGLIWYKQQPQALPPALNNDTGVMLLIPAGPFLYGPDGTEGVAPAFYIDRIEVTNSLYYKFCAAAKHALPPDFPMDRPNDPVVNVTIEDAATFAKWADKRLPDALEWEKAYRGSKGRRYPWGDEADPKRANVADNSTLPEHRLQNADSRPEGGSPYNILHMAGNAAEYVRTVNPPSPEDLDRMSKLLTPPPSAREAWYGVHGGSFDQPLDAALPWKRIAVPARFRSADVGFRCVKDPPRR